ncbi:hypothetical protein OH77DRAFT_1424222 [Trametes cingulata]|nr:hypothetical protein OH77DRAFT_1424222 [Trametes cingulata]
MCCISTVFPPAIPPARALPLSTSSRTTSLLASPPSRRALSCFASFLLSSTPQRHACPSCFSSLLLALVLVVRPPGDDTSLDDEHDDDDNAVEFVFNSLQPERRPHVPILPSFHAMPVSTPTHPIPLLHFPLSYPIPSPAIRPSIQQRHMPGALVPRRAPRSHPVPLVIFRPPTPRARTTEQPEQQYQHIPYPYL